MAHDGALVHAVTHAIRTHRLDRFSRREMAVAILDAVEPLIRADERTKQPRVEIEAALGEPTTCRVWVDDQLLFSGVDHLSAALIDGRPHGTATD